MEFFKRIKSFGPMLAAVVLAACIGTSLYGYEAPVYEVEASEVSENDENQGASAEPEETITGSFDLEDGVYYGTGTGFAGDITVAVQIKDKQIAAIEVVEVEADDDAFFNRAKGVIDKIIEKQSLDVDVVSGATYSSRGIINAVKNALTGEVDTNKTASSAASVGAGSKTVSQVEDASAYNDGEYYGTGTGFAGPLTVKVTISGGKIAAIEITDTGDGSSYISKASALISSIISAQSTNVDTVSGATYSSVGIIEAVRDALSKAAASGTAPEVQQTTVTLPEQNPGVGVGSTTVEKAEEASSYQDGTYYGTGIGFAGDLTVKVTISGGKISSIDITETKDGDEYIGKASSLLNAILSAQSTNVDTVSGATYSSVGIIEAVRDALSKAAVSGSQAEQSPADTSKEDDEDSRQNPVTGTVPYDEGIYYGTAEGYADDITVAVVIQDHTIKAILITETQDDEAFLSRAMAVVDTVMENQTTDDVDTVSGATYSSTGILNAIKEALAEAERVTNGTKDDADHPSDDKNPSDSNNTGNGSGDGNDGTNDGSAGEDGTGNKNDGSAGEEGSGNENDGSAGEEETGGENGGSDAEEGTVYKNGIYHAVVLCEPDEDELFEPYCLSAQIVIKNDEITAVTDVKEEDAAEDSLNTRYIEWAAEGRSTLTGMIEQILTIENAEALLEHKSTEELLGEDGEFDAVSRATCSSRAILEAVKQALSSAKEWMISYE